MKAEKKLGSFGPRLLIPTKISIVEAGLWATKKSLELLNQTREEPGLILTQKGRRRHKQISATLAEKRMRLFPATRTLSESWLRGSASQVCTHHFAEGLARGHHCGEPGSSLNMGLPSKQRSRDH